MAAGEACEQSADERQCHAGERDAAERLDVRSVGHVAESMRLQARRDRLPKPKRLRWRDANVSRSNRTQSNKSSMHVTRALKDLF